MFLLLSIVLKGSESGGHSLNDNLDSGGETNFSGSLNIGLNDLSDRHSADHDCFVNSGNLGMTNGLQINSTAQQEEESKINTSLVDCFDIQGDKDFPGNNDADNKKKGE